MRRGFTLLEVLVVTAILGMLILLLNQGVAFGIRASSAQLRQEQRHGDLDAVDRALRHLIAQADPGIFPEPAALRGSSATLDLVTELPIGTEPVRSEAALFASGGDLRLRWTPVRHVVPFGPKPLPQQMTLLTGVSGVDFAYSDGRGWSAAWSADRLPLLVRVTLHFADPARHWPPIEVSPVREPLQQ